MLQKGLAFALFPLKARRTLSALQTIARTVLGDKATAAVMMVRDFMVVAGE